MRFNKQETHPFGEARYRKSFAFFPKEIKGTWIWLEYFLIREYWGQKEDFRFDSYKQGEERSSFYCKWTFQSVTLPEDPDYQKWLLKNSKLTNVLG